jgi:hypothetical protein
MGTRTESIWLRVRTSGGLLWMRWWTFGFHKMRGISWVAQDVLASQEGLCSMEWVSQLVSYISSTPIAISSKNETTNSMSVRPSISMQQLNSWIYFKTIWYGGIYCNAQTLQCRLQDRENNRHFALRSKRYWVLLGSNSLFVYRNDERV